MKWNEKKKRWKNDGKVSWHRGSYYGDKDDRVELRISSDIWGSNIFRLDLKQWRIPGEGPDPPSPHQTWRLFETEILTSTGSYITFYLADFFLMKHTLTFASKLNFRDIKKCHWLCVWGIPSYDLFASVRKAVFPAPTVTGVQIEKHVVVSVSSNLPPKSTTVLSEPKFGPHSPQYKNSWIRPCKRSRRINGSSKTA